MWAGSPRHRLLPVELTEGTMSTDERARHELHGRLADVLGDDEAATLMGYLPPVGWADVATKHDLDVVRRDVADLRTDILDIRTDIRELRTDAAAHVRTFMLATSASVLTTASLAFAAARFA
jgi:hypothetical protein